MVSKNITPKFPKFRFKVADVFNSLYEKNGINKGEKFHFPFHDKEFDFIFLTSVFTHMLPDEMEKLSCGNKQNHTTRW